MLYFLKKNNHTQPNIRLWVKMGTIYFFLLKIGAAWWQSGSSHPAALGSILGVHKISTCCYCDSLTVLLSVNGQRFNYVDPTHLVLQASATKGLPQSGENSNSLCLKYG